MKAEQHSLRQGVVEISRLYIRRGLHQPKAVWAIFEVSFALRLEPGVSSGEALIEGVGTVHLRESTMEPLQ